MMRSKTKIIEDGKEPGIWGFDGSSTNQAEGASSDCVLKPVYTCMDPTRGAGDILVLCEVLLPETFEPHSSNKRALLTPVAEKFAGHESLFGIEQEYTFFKEGRPLGWPNEGYYYPAPQGPYYCGVGAVEIAGREIVEAHTEACMRAGSGHLRHQRRGHARPVGVPGRPPRPGRGLRPALDGPLPAVPRRRGLRRQRLHLGQADPGRLERRRCAHQLLDQPHARGVRRDHRGVRGDRRPRQGRGAPRGLRPRLRGAPHRPPRDRPLLGVPLRRVRPRCVDPHPVAGRPGRQGLHRGPSSERQHRPVRRDPPDGEHGVLGASSRSDRHEPTDHADAGASSGPCPDGAPASRPGTARARRYDPPHDRPSATTDPRCADAPVAGGRVPARPGGRRPRRQRRGDGRRPTPGPRPTGPTWSCSPSSRSAATRPRTCC